MEHFDRFYQKQLSSIIHSNDNNNNSEKSLFESIKNAIFHIPKTDYHCHLNGSISSPLLQHFELLLNNNNNNNNNNTEQYTLDKNNNSESIKLVNPKDKMNFCFSVFDRIYKVMGNLAFTRLAVQDLLFYSAAERIVYLEIRTSLRNNLKKEILKKEEDENNDASKKDYLLAVIETVEHLLAGGRVDFRTGALLPPLSENSNNNNEKEEWSSLFCQLYKPLIQVVLNHNNTNIDNRSNEEIVKEVYQTKILSFLQQHMHVRLLLSVNRAHPVEESREAIVLAKEVQSAQIQKYKNENNNHHQLLKSICWLVGIDLSGNCYKGDLDALLSLFQTELQGVSLPVTMHAGEKQDETELQHMYDYAPPRYGHLVFTDDRLLTAILTKPVRENEKIPNVEICITSNLLTSGHESVRQHHLCTIWKLFCDVLYKKNENRDETMFDVFVKHPQKCLDDSLLLRTETWKNLQDDYLSEHHQHDRLVLPNIALHTDDRGVFETSMTDELALFLQHPSVLHLNENENKELLFYRVCAFVYVLNVLSLANAFPVSSDIIQNDNNNNFQLQYLMDQFYAV